MNFLQLKNSTIFLKVLFVLSIAIIFFIGAITFKRVTDLKQTSHWLTKNHKIQLELEQLMSYLKDGENGQRGFIITKDPSFLKPYYLSENAINLNLRTLDSLTSEDPVQQKQFANISLLIKKRQTHLSTAIELVKQNNFDQTRLSNILLIGNETMSLLRKRIEALISQGKKIEIVRNSDYENAINYTPLFVYLTLIITLILITTSYLKMNQDLTNLKDLNNQLLTTIEANNLSEVIGSFGNWQLDLKSGKQTYSDNLFRMLGVAPNSFEPSQEEFHKFIHPDDLDYVNEQTKDLHTLGILPYFVYRIIRKDGEIRFFKVRGEISKNVLEQKTLIATTTDVTEEVLATRNIEERNKELENNNKELSAFNYIASHDLQEPLRKIETFISRFKDKEYESLSENSKMYTQRILSSTNRMRILIDDLLHFSRTNKIEKVFEKSDLNEFLENSKLAMTQRIEDTNTTIISENLPILNVIPFQIQQLFTNIISNAIKYSKPDVDSILKIKSELISANTNKHLPNTDQKFHKLSFEDNGIGFEQDYADQIFILFNRLHNKEDFEGTGIGLAICKKIVENHNGYIYAEGILNKGSKFFICLPAE